MYETKPESIYVERPEPSSGPISHEVEEFSKKSEIDHGNEALLLRVGKATHVDLKLADDGHVRYSKCATSPTNNNAQTVLIPQPTSDESDPLNWPWSKKHIMLLIVALSGFCGDFGSGSGVPAIIPQSVAWHITPNHVNYAGNLNIAMT